MNLGLKSALIACAITLCAGTVQAQDTPTPAATAKTSDPVSVEVKSFVESSKSQQEILKICKHFVDLKYITQTEMDACQTKVADAISSAIDDNLQSRPTESRRAFAQDVGMSSNINFSFDAALYSGVQSTNLKAIDAISTEISGMDEGVQDAAQKLAKDYDNTHTLERSQSFLRDLGL